MRKNGRWLEHGRTKPVEIWGLPKLKLDASMFKVFGFWASSIYCYVLGANPPSHVNDGFVRRLWRQLSIDKVSFQPNGICIIRFSKSEDKDMFLIFGPLFFDNKPFIIKNWSPELKCVKDKPDLVNIWVRFYYMELKFWGKALPKIAGLVGKAIRCDKATDNREFLEYARFMVEVKVGDTLPEVVKFIDEKDQVHKQEVYYEWKPLVCSLCKGLAMMRCAKRGRWRRSKLL
ncbi:uncharacterized protein LOC141590159 [Silene latifolia]|uniref:uncharacterized protein LOC141590159 n=1 Tax=Silene latifolia TaxID=37657 RepID=UPI003D7826B9